MSTFGTNFRFGTSQVKFTSRRELLALFVRWVGKKGLWSPRGRFLNLSEPEFSAVIKADGKNTKILSPW